MNKSYKQEAAVTLCANELNTRLEYDGLVAGARMTTTMLQVKAFMNRKYNRTGSAV